MSTTSPRSAERRSRLVAVGVLLSVALCGFLAGIAVDRRLQLGARPRSPALGDAPPLPRGIDRPPLPRGGLRGLAPGTAAAIPPRPPIAEMMARELGLDASQKARIDSIVDVQMREMQVMMEPMRARADSLLERTRSAIDATLTPAQRATLEARRQRGIPTP